MAAAGSLIAAASDRSPTSSEILLWSTQSADATARSVQRIGVTSGRLRALALSRSGGTLAGAIAKEVFVWQLSPAGRAAMKPRRLAAHSTEVTALALSADGKTVASGEGTGIHLTDLRSGSRTRTLPAGASGLTALEFSPDGHLLAAAGRSGGIQLWDLQRRVPQRILGDPDERLMSLAFSRAGDRLVGAGTSSIRFWSPSRGAALVSLYAIPPAAAHTKLPEGGKDQLDPAALAWNEYLIATPEGYYGGSPSADRFATFRVGGKRVPLETLQSRYYRPDLIRLALAGREIPTVRSSPGETAPGSVIWISPKEGAAVKGDRIPVEIEVTGTRQVARMEILVSGGRADTDNGATGAPPPPGARSASARFGGEVALPPNEASLRLQAIAIFADGTRSPRAEIRVTRPEALPKPERLLGLCVGVSDYQDPQVTDLKYAHQDATALAEELNRQREGYETVRVSSLVNTQATKLRVLRALDDLVQDTERGDTVVLFFAGHGTTDGGRNFFFAPYDYRRDEPGGALPWNEVVQRMARLSERGKRVLVLLDACRSGSTANNEELAKVALSARAGVMMLTSCRGSEVALELGAPLEHGAFTLAILEALRGRALPPGEKKLTLLSLSTYLVRRVRELTKDQQHPHIPYLFDFDLEAAIVSPGVPVSAQ